jgi:hypothetical protein
MHENVEEAKPPVAGTAGPPLWWDPAGLIDSLCKGENNDVRTY